MEYKNKMKITLLVMLIIFALVNIVAYRIRDIEKNTSLEIMEIALDSASEDVQRYFNIQRDIMLTMAEIINTQAKVESTQTQDIVDSFKSQSLIDNLGLLLPDNKLMWPYAKPMDFSDVLSFDEEAARGIHFSDRERSVNDRNKFVVRNFVPVVRDNKIRGMLYGRIDLNNFPEIRKKYLFDDQARFIVLDGNTGEILFNNKSNTMDNLYSLGAYDVKSGDSSEEILDKLKKGIKGKALVKSLYGEENVYFMYKPLPINQWRICISVPEKVVLARLRETDKMLYGLFGCELFLLLGYFLWLQRTARKELQIQKDLAEKDILTGTLNRNRFEMDLAGYAQQCSQNLFCIYIDGNGLHELNNDFGHEAGDDMLRKVAKVMVEQFGETKVYRVGGDEFVAFAFDVLQEEIESRINYIRKQVEASGYSISDGYCCQQKPVDIDTLVKCAEKEMLENKKHYYEQQDNDRRTR
ncbi:sensor domain-containing diguanylate cyclase [uncultured Phascolarctobacterium sp.]|uniref:sensor domain-containing diguanylate cyclase n=1 Tax=uncultured Phascolarctobacterium sp. TaxID=512296 RepID=UPI002635D804|nr:sensor domain-containing diguanylate cyclase [uncultured Phascolarctobacterium sp.]